MTEPSESSQEKLGAGGIDPVNAASIVIFERYIGILEELMVYPSPSGIDEHYLIKMCHTAIDHPYWPVDKMSRWLGFVQGIMIYSELLNTQEERDSTRPLFHKAYKELGQKIPGSVKV